MSLLRLTWRDDAIVPYTLDRDGVRVGEIRWHAAHASVLRIGPQSWWLADDVATGLHAAGASTARRVFAQLLEPRTLSLRADGGEQVLARTRRRRAWSARENGLDCEIGGTRWTLRCRGAWGGRLGLADAAGQARGELAVGLLGRSVEARTLPWPLP
jgi:hypothetical protein